MTTKELHFTYDPLQLVRICLQRHVEENIQGKTFKAKTFACYDFIFKVLNDDTKLEQLLEEYVKRHNLEVITLSNWRQDARLIFEIIYEQPEYRSILVEHQRHGFGQTGLGVYDRTTGLFFDCGMAHHFVTIRRIVEEYYPEKHEALHELWFDHELKEFGGFTRNEIELFIMGNFELVGGQKSAAEYL